MSSTAAVARADGAAPRRPDATTAVMPVAVFYDPHMHHHLSSGWELSELTSQRVRTTTGVLAHVSLRLSKPVAAEPGAAPVYSLTAAQLSREALRAVVLAGTDDSNADADADTDDDGSLEAALDRWLPLVHLHIVGGRHGSAAALSPHAAAAATVTVAAKEAVADDGVPGASHSPASPHRSHADAAGWPVQIVVPAPATASIDLSPPVLVLSFLQSASEWRRLRRAARLAAPSGDGRGSGTFVCDDDRLFTQWLRSKRDQRWRWRRAGGSQASAAAAAAAAVKGAETLSSVEMCGAPRVVGTAGPSAEREATARPVIVESRTASSSDSDDGTDSAPVAEAAAAATDRVSDAAARRAAILAAVARRQVARR
ncbi:hypothetical protein NESM_000544400 [Novymonas esmeraldas]|uniref:Uncharacterized protein n=1 Tax=Novymonas esmeraldas TaxID=1808958 RepID=A0AAW0ERV0_9TRYP